MQFPIREMGKADRSVSTSLLNYKEEVVGNKKRNNHTDNLGSWPFSVWFGTNAVAILHLPVCKMRYLVEL